MQTSHSEFLMLSASVVPDGRLARRKCHKVYTSYHSFGVSL